MRLPEDLETLFKQQVEQLEEEKHMAYVTSIERIARKEGRQEGSVRLLVRLLAHRFGEIPEAVEDRLERLPFEQLEALIESAMTVSSLNDFVTNLPENMPAAVMNGV